MDIPQIGLHSTKKLGKFQNGLRIISFWWQLKM